MPPIRRRGPYKQYIYDPNVPMARTTAWVRRQENIRQLQEEQLRQQEEQDPLSSDSEAERNEISEEESHSTGHESNSSISNEDDQSEGSVSLRESVSGHGSESENNDSEFETESEHSFSLSDDTYTNASIHSLRSGPSPLQEEIAGFHNQLPPLDNAGGNAVHHHPIMNHDMNNPPVVVNEAERNEQERLYHGANLSKRESDLLIMSFAVRWGLEDQAIEDLLRLIDCHLPAPVLGSKYLFLKRFPTPPSMTVRHFCPECSRLITAAGERAECECGQNVVVKDLMDNSSNYFVQLSISEQVQNLLSNDKLYSQLRQVSTDSDVVTGKVYKRLLDSRVIGSLDITLQFNVDGVSPYKSSKVAMYPFQACINELPYRARRDNMILAGLYCGKGKPQINGFLKPIVDELTSLHHHGLMCHVPGRADPVNVKVHTILCSVDSVERPILQGISQFNGKYGCFQCLRRGMRVERGDGHARVYMGGVGERRTLQQHLNALQRLHDYNRTHRKKKKKIEGVKYASGLLLLPVFHIIKSFVPDYMHSVLEGVVKFFINFWITRSESQGKEWYLNSAKRKILTERLLSIRPPVEITRAPRGLDDLSYWKASELRAFLLYYSLPILKNLLPVKYLRHWLLLVYSLSIFLKQRISDDEFLSARAAINKFVEDISELYPGCQHLYTANTHLLLHLPKAVEDFGALWASSAFPYEDFNGRLCKLIKGTHNITPQLCKSFIRLRHISHAYADTFLKPNASVMSKDLCEKLIGNHHFSQYSRLFSEKLRLFGVPECCELTLVEKVVIQDLLQIDIKGTAESYRRLICNGTIIHAKAYGTLAVRDNSNILFNNGVCVSVSHIYVVKSNCGNISHCVLVGEAFQSLNNEICHERGLGISSNSVAPLYSLSGRTVAHLPQNFQNKCIAVPYGTSVCIVKLANNIERD